MMRVHPLTRKAGSQWNWTVLPRPSRSPRQMTPQGGAYITIQHLKGLGMDVAAGECTDGSTILNNALEASWTAPHDAHSVNLSFETQKCSSCTWTAHTLYGASPTQTQICPWWYVSDQRHPQASCRAGSSHTNLLHPLSP